MGGLQGENSFDGDRQHKGGGSQRLREGPFNQQCCAQGRASVVRPGHQGRQGVVEIPTDPHGIGAARDGTVAPLVVAGMSVCCGGQRACRVKTVRDVGTSWPGCRPRRHRLHRPRENEGPHVTQGRR